MISPLNLSLLDALRGELIRDCYSIPLPPLPSEDNSKGSDIMTLPLIRSGCSFLSIADYYASLSDF